MLKAVLFDLDDTLIDWSGFHGDWARMERQHLHNVVDYIRVNVHPLNDLDAYATEFRMRTMDAWTAARTSLRAPNLGTVLVETAVALGVPSEKLDARRLLEVYAWNAVPGTRMFPDVPGALMQLHRRHIKVGIITNAYQPMWIREVEMASHGILQHFPECRISAADIGYLKPHPTIFQAALNCLDVKPNEAVFVGDDPDADISGAEAAGLYAVLRYSPGQESEIEPSIAQDARITSLVQLLPILDRWFPGWR